MEKKKILLVFFIGILLIAIFGVTYALYNYSNLGSNNELVTGDIYMHFKESNSLTVSNMLPSSTKPDTYFEFTVDGKNTNTKYDIWYDITILRGEVPDGKTETNRINDKDLRFTLTEKVDDGEELTVVDNESYEGLLAGKKIWVNSINKNTTTKTIRRYRLYVWVGEGLIVGNVDADYTEEQWNNSFASVKVKVNGDFTKRTPDEPYNTVNVMYSLSGSGTYDISTTANVKEIYFNKMSKSAMESAYNAATLKADLTYNNEGTVLSWLEPDTVDNTKYIMYVVSDGKTYLTDGQSFFGGFNQVEKIEFNNIDTRRVTSMSFMFADLTNLTSIDISSFDTSNVIRMGWMFDGCTNLANINLTGIDTSSVTDFQATFRKTAITSMDISHFNTSNVESFVSMFERCPNLTSVNMEGLDLSNLTNASDMFNNSPLFTSFSLHSATFSSNTDLRNMLNIRYITTVDFSGLNLNGMTSASLLPMSRAASYIETINMSNVIGPNITSVGGMFSGCSNVQSINMSGAQFDNVSNTGGLLSGANNLQTIDLSNSSWKGAQSIGGMFSAPSTLATINLSGADFRTTTSTAGMFSGCSGLTTIDLSNVNFNSLINTNYMFSGLSNLTTIKVSNTWNVDNVTSSDSMFSGCTSLKGGGTPQTTYSADHTDKEYARIDGGANSSTPGYLTLKTN